MQDPGKQGKKVKSVYDKKVEEQKKKKKTALITHPGSSSASFGGFLHIPNL